MWTRDVRLPTTVTPISTRSPAPVRLSQPMPVRPAATGVPWNRAERRLAARMAGREGGDHAVR